jgi:hypothetical protein
VENALHHEVWAGMLTLQPAQVFIAKAWFKF